MKHISQGFQIVWFYFTKWQADAFCTTSKVVFISNWFSHCWYYVVNWIQISDLGLKCVYVYLFDSWWHQCKRFTRGFFFCIDDISCHTIKFHRTKSVAVRILNVIQFDQFKFSHRLFSVVDRCSFLDSALLRIKW